MMHDKEEVRPEVIQPYKDIKHHHGHDGYHNRWLKVCHGIDGSKHDPPLAKNFIRGGKQQWPLTVWVNEKLLVQLEELKNFQKLWFCEACLYLFQDGLNVLVTYREMINEAQI